MNRIIVTEGNIVRIKADAIITPINSDMEWNGGVDRAIYGVAGDFYHDQARPKKLHDLDIVIAKGNRERHDGNFNNVVFVVDDVRSPLETVVAKGLEAANSANYKNVLLPVMRTGTMLGELESSLDEVLDRLVLGIKNHFRDFPDSRIVSITIVVHNNSAIRSKLMERIARLKE